MNPIRLIIEIYREFFRWLLSSDNFPSDAVKPETATIPQLPAMPSLTPEDIEARREEERLRREAWRQDYYRNSYQAIRSETESKEAMPEREPDTPDWVSDQTRRPSVSGFYAVKDDKRTWTAFRSIKSGGWWVQKKPDGWSMSPPITHWKTLTAVEPKELFDPYAIEIE